ncbi:ABC transporter substrate-binding protein [Pandoraea cepalis]|uniref:ABC transporter substrate-binding protein n=1 Tax=Pandoraea cepalis TaxID=2508294 RepID=A0A5E4WFU7_9BURK|nr:transporter substrate-binding domain-containing protein [Pandoraea cepalis]VVE22444.1 ABC transporter substrate-binding protein [Pandoraea cepalis]
MSKGIFWKIAALFAVLTSSLLTTGAHAATLAEIKARGKLICGTQNATAPYAYQDPKTRTFVGYDVDMCHALAAGLGVALEHKPMSTEARIAELDMGRVDVVAGSMTYLPQRAQQVDYSLQYLQDAIRVLVKKKSGVTDISQLKGARVCATSGSGSAAIAGQVLKQAKIITFSDIAACYLALQDEKVDGVVGGELGLIRFQNNTKSGDDPTVLLPQPVFTEHMGIVVKKGNAALLAAINQVITQMDRSGALSAIYDKWLGSQSIYKLTRTFKVEPVDQP